MNQWETLILDQSESHLDKTVKSIKDEFVETWGTMMPGGVPTDSMKLLDFAYFGEEKRQTINFLDPLSLPNEAIRLFEKLFQIKKKVTTQLRNIQYMT